MNKLTEITNNTIKGKILESIITYIQKHGYSPTIREIGEMVDLKRTSSVQRHLTKMFEDGILETDHGYGTPRAIRVPGYNFVKNNNN